MVICFNWENKKNACAKLINKRLHNICEMNEETRPTPQYLLRKLITNEWLLYFANMNDDITALHTIQNWFECMQHHLSRLEIMQQ